MNILVFSWRDSKHPLSGGAEQVVREHMRGWISAGHSVTHFSSTFKGGPSIETWDEIIYIRKGLQLLGVQIEAFFWYLFGKHPKFDLVVDEFHGIPFFTPFYVRSKKVAILQEVAREVWLKNDLPFPFNIIIGVIGYIFEPLVYIFYKNIPFIVGSNSAKVELKKVGIPTRNIHVIPHGVVLFLPKILPKKEKIKTIIFLGALAKDKGIEDAIETFSNLNKKGDFRFWIIGRGGNDYVPKLKEKCANLGIESKTKFWGYVSDKEKFELLAKAHVMINPSLLEGWGLVNIEANSVGTPIVAYNSPGLVDSVRNGESGVICRENTPLAMSNEVLKILENNKIYTDLQSGSRAWSKNFSWEKSKTMSLTLISDIVNLD